MTIHRNAYRNWDQRPRSWLYDHRPRETVSNILRANGFSQQRAWWRTLNLSSVGLEDNRRTETSVFDVYR
jgi:hypothetical protein